MLARIEISAQIAENSSISEKKDTLVFVPKDVLLFIG